MASNNEISTLAKSAQDLSNKVKELQNLTLQFLSNNSTQAIDWNGVEASNPGSVKPEGDGAGDLVGFDFSPSEMANAIGALQGVSDYIKTQAVNFEKLAKPIV